MVGKRATRGFIAALALALLGAVDEPPPSRDDFFRELLSAEASAQTPRFGRVEGAYRPSKLDLMKDLRRFAQARDESLRLVLSIGPNGPQEKYTIVVVLADGEDFVMNGVMLADSAIMAKGTTPIASSAFAYFVFTLTTHGALMPVGNLREILGRVESPEQVFDCLLALWTPDIPVTYAADLRAADQDDVQRLMLEVNRRLRALRSTYEAGEIGQPDEATGAGER